MQAGVIEHAQVLGLKTGLKTSNDEDPVRETGATHLFKNARESIPGNESCQTESRGICRSLLITVDGDPDHCPLDRDSEKYATPAKS